MRDYSLRKRYGLTLVEYEAMVEAQEGLCALCGRATALVVDHDHKTGLVRGLLCRSCNSAIGILGDSEDGLMRAIDYLQRSAKREKNHSGVRDIAA